MKKALPLLERSDPGDVARGTRPAGQGVDPTCTHPAGGAACACARPGHAAAEEVPGECARQPRVTAPHPVGSGGGADQPCPGGPPRPGAALEQAQAMLPGLPEGYRCILMDPPWRHTGGGRRGADVHYPVHEVQRILEIIKGSGCFLPHAAGCHLWCWATSNFLPDALWLIEQLGFRYVTSCVWVKVMASHLPELCGPQEEDLQIGLGQYMRHCHELLLLGVRGRLPVPPPAIRPPSAILARRTEHSAKPERQYTLIESISLGPRLELFARRTRPGWDVWGDEV